MPEKEEELLITSFLSDNDAHLSVNSIIIVKGRGHQGVSKKQRTISQKLRDTVWRHFA